MSYAISAGHQRTLEAAESILTSGGHAVDAAIAAFLMSWVAEPCMSSAGGGGFAQVFFDRNPPVVFDFFCQTPQQKPPADEMDFFPVTVDFGAAKEVFHVGRGSTAVPGSVAGVFALHQHFGKIPMKELAQPAISAAKSGVVVNEFNHYVHQLLKAILDLHPTGRSLYIENGEIAAIGTRRFMPGLADYLEYLALEGPNAFYEGEIADKIATDHRNHGGCLRRDDLSGYKVNINKPLDITFHQHLISANPQPGLGGFYLKSYFDYIKEITAALHPFTPQYLENLFGAYQSLESEKKQIGGALGRFFAQLKTGGTTHFNIIDKAGNAVSLSSSNGEGSGSFIAHTDIQLNNMLGEAALLPGGFHSWEPNTRLASLMTPTLVFDAQKELKLVLGSSGAGRIASALFQIIKLTLLYDFDLQTAVQSPRAHLQDGIFNMEPGFEEGYRHPDERSRVWSERSIYFGGVNGLENKSGRWTAEGDQRRFGVGTSG